jgi:chorismate-pyruvate lyase
MAESLSRNSPHQTQPFSSAVNRAAGLIAVFHRDTESFASLSAVNERDVPEPYAGLLAHQSHMTVAMERFHGGPVKLQVVAERSVLQGAADVSYCREILLSKADGRIVQYGIVRIDLEPLPAASREAILCKEEPLGRILIASGMHRDVQAVELLKLAPGRAFGQLMAATGSCYGRVAEIRLDGRPAVELLEVVPSFEG